MSDTTAPAAKRVGFLELFFDLVFVFAVTELVAVLHDDHSAAGWGRAAMLLWLVWWAWSQYAWAGNAIDLDRRVTRLWVLVATGAMLGAATALPQAFGTVADALVFAVPYAAVRLVGLGLYWHGLAGNPAHQAALRTYVPIQLLSPLLVVVGAGLATTPRTAVWALAIVVDVVSAATAGRGEFRIDPAHFAERHGLIVIIALGETVVATGVTAAGVGLDAGVALALAVAFVAIAAAWWCFFDWVHGAAEARLAREPDHRRRSNLARDLFTFGHLPVVAGIVVLAAAIEEALRDPGGGLDTFGVAALATGPALYLAGFVAANLRATGRLLVTRAAGALAVLVAATAGGAALPATAALGAVTAVIVAVAAIESARPPRRSSPVRLSDDR